jgi:predicted outer membrane protein
MSFAISRIVGAHLAAVGLLISAASVFAQEAPPDAPNRPRAGRPFQRIIANRPVDPARTADHDIAEWLGICNQEEVALAKLAASKAQNKDVKQFAETLAKDHNQQLANLQKFGAQIVALDAGSNANRQAEAPRAPNQPATQTRTTGAAQGGLDFLAAKREIAQRCLASAQEKWNNEKSAECEMGFVGAQLVAHEQMLNTAKVLKQYASPELQAAIDQGIQSTESHMKHAKELLNSLASAERKSDRENK